MTQDDVCALIESLGGTEYPDRTKSAGTRCFSMRRLVDAPKCACNDKPPCVHVNTYADFRHPSTGQVFPGGVEFEVAGEAGDGRWLKALIYSVKREEVSEIYPDIEKIARAIWMAFVEGIAHRAL
jgi:hypothetical protein